MCWICPRKEVRDHAFESVAAVLHSANIEYVKWDMNRQLSDLGSVELPADRQGKLYHRYVLGVYELQDRLLQEFRICFWRTAPAAGEI